MNTIRLTLPALALAGALLAGCGGGDAPSTSPSTSVSAAANAADVEFAQQMIPHHEQAVAMAEMVPTEGVSAELIALADAVEAAQQPEIDEMTAMLENWGEAPPSEHAGHGSADMPGMMSAEDMTTLDEASGPAFERMWLTMMIEHHEGAISMAEDEIAEGTDAEAQALAQKIIDAQRAEITQMEQMLDTLGT